MKENKSDTLVISLGDFWNAFKRYFLLLLAVLIVSFAVITVYAVKVMQPTYSSTVTVYAMAHSADMKTETSYGNFETVDISIATYLVKDVVNVINSKDNVATPVAETLQKNGLDVDANSVLNVITTENPEDTRVLYITATADSREHAALIAQTFAETACTYYNGLMKYEMLQITDSAKAETATRTNPVSLITYAVIAIGLAFVTLCVCTVITVSHDTVATAEDIRDGLELNLLGDIPNRSNTRRGKGKGYYRSYKTYERGGKQ